MISTLILFLIVCNGIMCGVIWFVQLVHYPMMARFDRERFCSIQLEHQSRTSRVVMLPMLLSLLASVGLMVVAFNIWSILNLLLTAVWCCSTAFWQIPLHNRLAATGFDAQVHNRLVQSNWVRTFAWSAQFALNLVMLNPNESALTLVPRLINLAN